MKTISLYPLFFLSLALPLGACQGGPPAGAAGFGGPVPVKIATVQAGELAETSDFNASLKSRKSVTLQPQVEGQVTQILVQAGDPVTAGAPLLQIDPAEQAAAVGSNVAAAEAARADINAAAADRDTATADIATAQADVAAARDTLRSLDAQRRSDLATLKFNQQQYNRYAQLFRQGGLSRQSLDSYGLQVQTARAALAKTNAEIKAQQSTVNQKQTIVNQKQSIVSQKQAVISQKEKVLIQNQANTQQEVVKLEYYRINAPFAGTVGEIPTKVGDLVTSSTNLLTVTQNQPLEVHISIPIERAPQVRQGTPVQLINPQGKVMGTSRVFFVAPNVNNETQSVLVKSLFDNANNQLRADQLIQARVVWQQRSGALVPVNAVTKKLDKSFVFVAENVTNPKGQKQLIARQKVIQVGEIQGNNYQVISGLQPGDRIITSGVQKLEQVPPDPQLKGVAIKPLS